MHRHGGYDWPDDGEECPFCLLDEALDVVQGLCEQSCSRDDGTLDSMAITAYAEGLHLLAIHGRLDIEADVGRRVIGRLKEGE